MQSLKMLTAASSSKKGKDLLDISLLSLKPRTVANEK